MINSLLYSVYSQARARTPTRHALAIFVCRGCCPPRAPQINREAGIQHGANGACSTMLRKKFIQYVILFLLRPFSRSIYTHTTTVFHGAISKLHSNTCHHKRPTSSSTSYSSPYTAYHQQQTLVTNHNTCSL